MRTKIPYQQSGTFSRYFDSEFTDQSVELTPPDNNLVIEEGCEHEDFAQFSFLGLSMLAEDEDRDDEIEEWLANERQKEREYFTKFCVQGTSVPWTEFDIGNLQRI